MNFPQNVKYTNEHEWIRLEGDVAYVGITDYAQEQLGDIVFVDIPTEGETLEAAETAGLEVEAVYDAFTTDAPKEDSERLYYILRRRCAARSNP